MVLLFLYVTARHVSHAGYSAENSAPLQGPVFCRLAWHDVVGCNTSDFELSFSSSVNEDGLDSPSI
jgi:hypothetical protein